MTIRATAGYYANRFVILTHGMAHFHDKDKRKGILAPGRSSDVDRCMEETETMLHNTRAFFDGLADSDPESREYIKAISDTLERDVQRLQARKEAE